MDCYVTGFYFGYFAGVLGYILFLISKNKYWLIMWARGHEVD